MCPATEIRFLSTAERRFVRAFGILDECLSTISPWYGLAGQAPLEWRLQSKAQPLVDLVPLKLRA